MTSGRDLVTVVSITVFTGLVLGPWGALAAAAVAAVVMVALGTARARGLFLLAAMGLLAGSGVTVLVESPVISRWPVTFASDRAVAAALGAAAASAVFAHLVVAVGEDRAAVVDLLPPWVRASIPLELVRDAVAVLATLLSALLLRAATSPVELPAGIEVVRANLELGIGYASGLPSGVSVAPLTPTLLLVTGFSATALATLALGTIAFEGAELARRARRPPVLGAVIAVALPSAWGASVPVLLATALLGGAAILLAPRLSRDDRHDVLAGALAAVALFADPSALAGAICLGGWLVIEGRATVGRLARFGVPVVVGVGLLVVGFRRIDAGLRWWGAGGDLPDQAAWVVAADLLLGLLVIVPVALRRRDVATALGLGLLVIAVILAHVSRSGSPSWVWGAVLVAARAFAGDRRPGLRTTAAVRRPPGLPR